jgi:hypothetical protein
VFLVLAGYQAHVERVDFFQKRIGAREESGISDNIANFDVWYN